MFIKRFKLKLRVPLLKKTEEASTCFPRAGGLDENGRNSHNVKINIYSEAANRSLHDKVEQMD